MLHSSVAVYVYERDLLQPVPASALRAETVTVGVPHASEAVAEPADGNDVGLKPKSEDAGQKVNTGAVTSTVHVNV